MTQQTHKSPTQNKVKDNENKTSYELESEIHETRGAITEDIKVLSDKLSPAHLKEEAKGAAKDAVAGVKNAAMDKAIEVKDALADKAVEVKDKAVELKDVVAEKAVELKEDASEKLAEAKDAVVETIDEVGDVAKRFGSEAWRFTSANAVPLALIGIGAGWMIANSKRSRSEPQYSRSLSSRYDEDDDLEDEFDPAYDAVVPDSGRPRQRGRRAATGRELTPATARAGSTARATRPMGRSASSLRERASGIASQPGEATRTAQHKIEDSAAQGVEYLRKGAAQTTEYVRKGVARARDATLTFADENPIALAMATLVAGVGVGMLLPSTDRETKLLEPAREKFDRLIGDAREAATDVAQVARETANDSFQALT